MLNCLNLLDLFSSSDLSFILPFNMCSCQPLPPFWPFAQFRLREYIRFLATRLVVKQFQPMLTDRKRSRVRYTRNGPDRQSAAGGWLKCGIHCGGRDTALCRDVAICRHAFRLYYERRGLCLLISIHRVKWLGPN